MTAVFGGALLMLAAWLVEVLFGYPEWLYRRIRHPVVWQGALIDGLDRSLKPTNPWPRPALRPGHGGNDHDSPACSLPGCGNVGAVAGIGSGFLGASGHCLEPDLLPQPVPPRRCRIRPTGGGRPHRRSCRGGTRCRSGDCGTAARGRRARRSGESCRKHVRRRRRAAVLGCRVRSARAGGVQGRQHAGFDDRPSRRALRGVRRLRGAPRRRGELPPGKTDRAPGRGGESQARGLRRDVARRAPTSLSQCRMARERGRRRAGRAAFGPAELCRCRIGRTLAQRPSRRPRTE